MSKSYSPPRRTISPTSSSSSILPLSFKGKDRDKDKRSTASLFSMTSRNRMVLPFPRAVTRGLLALLGILGLYVLSQAAKSDVGEGEWDVSTFSERKSSSAGINFRNKWKYWSNTNTGGGGGGGGIDEEIPPTRARDRPNYSREESSTSTILTTTKNPYGHPGKSRRIISKTGSSFPLGSPPPAEEYEFRELPTLEEAFDFLHPLLRKVKDDYPQVPREHELTAPIFSPFITDDLKDRYRHLRDDWLPQEARWVRGEEKRWFLVTVCRQVAGMLADWFAAWTVLADFLGPETLVFSLLEGDSADGSGEILAEVMRAHLLNIGVPPGNIHIKTHLPAIDWESVHRIEQLAGMRNAGMQPFYDTLTGDKHPLGKDKKYKGLSPDGHPWTGVVFYNDVYLSAQHFLELMHQHFFQDADMTCAWDHAGRWFYDGWVGRDMSGDLYTPFPVKEEDKDLPQKLFQSHAPTLSRYEKMLPFQVFAGWNGITVLSPIPFMEPYNVRFRRGTPRKSAEESIGLSEEESWECQASESSFISWDFWKYGFGRIAVVPGVHATYGKEDAMVRGWLEWPQLNNGYSEKIQWDDKPPGKVRCHDWPDKPGKGWWAWDTVRWVSPPKLQIFS